MPHEVDYAMMLVNQQSAQLLQGRGMGALKGNVRVNVLNYFLDTHPFSLDVEFLHVSMERFGGNGDNVQVGVQLGWGNALVGGQAAYKMIHGDEETFGSKAVGAIDIFPGHGIKVFVCCDEQDAILFFVQGELGRAASREQCLVDGFAVGYRVIKRLW